MCQCTKVVSPCVGSDQASFLYLESLEMEYRRIAMSLHSAWVSTFGHCRSGPYTLWLAFSLIRLLNCESPNLSSSRTHARAVENLYMLFQSVALSCRCQKHHWLNKGSHLTNKFNMSLSASATSVQSRGAFLRLRGPRSSST